ncbi:MAG: hypothetical protein BHW56_08565 [Acetobacter sp. 46_36]|nr:MAG: hypothetical protein BHW56_08565 [Acetobacter sp. 46_36]
MPQYSDTLKVSDGGAVNGMENLFDDIRIGGTEYSNRVIVAGGGSSYTKPELCSSVIHTQGFRNGAGYIIGEWLWGFVLTGITAYEIIG